MGRAKGTSKTERNTLRLANMGNHAWLHTRISKQKEEFPEDNENWSYRKGCQMEIIASCRET